MRAARPAARGDRAVVIVLAVAMVGFMAVVTALQRSRLGRGGCKRCATAWRACRAWLHPVWPKAAVFAVSAAMAGVSGCALRARAPGGEPQRVDVVPVAAVDHHRRGRRHRKPGPPAWLVLRDPRSPLPGVLSTGEPSAWLTPLFGVAAIALARRPGGRVGRRRTRPPTCLVAVTPPNRAPAPDPAREVLA